MVEDRMDPHSQLSHSTLLTRSDDILSADLDGETVLLKIERGAYFGLDDIGGEVWRLLETPLAAGELYGALSGRYDADMATIENDLAPVLVEMLDEGLIRVAA